MNKKQIEATIFELIDFIIEDSTKNQHNLCMTNFFWPEKKKWFPMEAEFDDIGDYLTFVAWAGKIFKKNKYISFAKDQVLRWEKLAKLPSGWWITKIDCSQPSPNKLNQFVISIYDLQDAILGLYELYQLTKDKYYLNELSNILNKVILAAKKTNGFLPNKLINYLLLAVPWSSANPAVSGIIAEHAYLIGEESKTEKFNKLADKLIGRWLDTPLWQKHHLFHQGYNSYFHTLSPYSQTRIMKENSNIIYAALMRPEKYQSLIDYSIKQILKFSHKSGAFFGKWDVTKNKVVPDYFDKTQNFTLIDLFTDVATRSKVFPRNKLLKASQDCADFWISRKNKKTQLIPNYIKADGKPLYQISKLDQSADLYSSFLRLYTATNNTKYLKEAETGAKVLKKYFGDSSWWQRIVNSNTGEPAANREVPSNDKPAGRNLTKYVGGALRFYLSLHQVKSGKSMQKDKLLWLMSRDR